VYGPGPQEPVYGPGPQEPLFAGEAAPPPDGGWREEVRSAATLNLVAGIWLIIAPWVLGYAANDPKWNDVIFGIIVGAIGLTRVLGAYRESWLSWLNALIGIWIFISAFTIVSSGTASANNIILGAIVFILAIWSASASDSARRAVRERRGYGNRPLTH
jgi:hypothetical protein